MPDLHQWLETLWWTKKPPLPLRMIAGVYSAVSRRHLLHRASHPITPPIPLISVGNITAGGSGKTPFVIWLAKALQESGYSPVLLSRGDGGRQEEPLLIASQHTANEVGDEAKLLYEQSSCPVIAGRDRIRGSQIAAEYGDIIILDDGFQYRQLQRCCDIVLVPVEGPGNGFQIPAGPLREPISSLDRADIIVRTGSTHAIPLQTTNREWHWQAIPDTLSDLMQTGTAKPSQAIVVTAIARPQRFIGDLQKAGVDIASTRLFPDHHRFSEAEVASLLAQPFPVIVTGKDAVKLRPLWPVDKPLWVLHQRPEAEEGLLDAILSILPPPSRSFAQRATDS